MHAKHEYETEYLRTVPENAIKKIKENLLEQKELYVYSDKINEKIQFLTSLDFQSMSFREKKEWFHNSIEILKSFQNKHFEFLKNYRLEVIRTKFDYFTTIGFIICDVNTYIEEENDYYIYELDQLTPILASCLTIFNSGEKHYQELNQKNKAWLKEFFEKFTEEYKLTFKKEKVNESYSFVFIPKEYEIIQDEKKRLINKELRHQLDLSVIEAEKRVWFKQQMFEEAEPEIYAVIRNVLEYPGLTNYSKLKLYLKNKKKLNLDSPKKKEKLNLDSPKKKEKRKKMNSKKKKK